MENIWLVGTGLMGIEYAKVLEKTVIREMGELAGKLNYTTI